MRAGRLGPQGQGRVEVREPLSPMAQDAAPMPVSSSSVPAVRAATLDPEQHGTVRPPATETTLGPQPGLSPSGGAGHRVSSFCPHMSEPTRPSGQGCLSPAARTARCPAPQGFLLGRGWAGTAATLAACTPGMSPPQ